MAKPYKRIPNSQRKPISQSRLKELVDYDPLTGRFVRTGAARPQSAWHAGKGIGYVKKGSHSSGGGYIMLSVDGKTCRAHHMAWLYMTGELPTTDIDHIDGDRANNRWANLRSATRSQNIANSKRPIDNKSGFKGVSFDEKRGLWKAQIGIGKNAKGYYDTKYLGRFATKEEAALCYRKAAGERFGEFARCDV